MVGLRHFPVGLKQHITDPVLRALVPVLADRSAADHDGLQAVGGFALPACNVRQQQIASRAAWLDEHEQRRIGKVAGRINPNDRIV